MPAPALLPLLPRRRAAAQRRCVRSHLRDPEQGNLVLMLLAALAAGRPLDELEFGATPVLEQRTMEGQTALVLDLVEIKSSPDGAREAGGVRC